MHFALEMASHILQSLVGSYNLALSYKSRIGPWYVTGNAKTHSHSTLIFMGLDLLSPTLFLAAHLMAG